MLGVVTSSKVDAALSGRIARLTLNDPDHGNPINLATIADLHDGVRTAIRAQSRVIVLSSTGRFFSVGGDLRDFGSVDDVPTYLDDLAAALHRVIAELMHCDAVVIAAVQGPAAGAGFPLAAAADLVIASDDATFSLGYTKIGLSIDGGTSLLSRTVGLHTLLRLALLNEKLSAARACACGLVARVVGPAQLESATNEMADMLAAGSAQAQGETKRLIRTAAEPAPERALQAETMAIRSLAGSPDGQEGVRAFLDKRKPNFA
jgi:2-(1,2-epoxy-1,2-dihydrophenyl)acetyl-CoA isomerase